MSGDAEFPSDREVGGDPVCWLHAICPECGAMPSEEPDEVCWRCGTPHPRSSS